MKPVCDEANSIPSLGSTDSREPETAAGHWTADIGNNVSCSNCGSEIAGLYCSACGQKQLRQRLHAATLFKDLVSRAFDWESGLLRTLRDLLVRPGRLARDYVSGKQRPYVTPLTIFFLGAAAQLLILWLLSGEIEQRIREQAATAPQANSDNEAYAKMEQALGGDFPGFLADLYISTLQQAYSYAAFLFFCVPLAFFLKVFHGATGERFQLGETLIFALYVMGGILLITALTTLSTTWIHSGLQITLAISTYFLFVQHGHTHFFRPGFASRLLTLMSTLLAVLIFFSSFLLIIAGSLILKLLWIRFAG